MGFLTRWLAGKMEDPAKRQADFEKHMTTTMAKCEEIKKNWEQPTKTHRWWTKDRNQLTYKFSLEPMLVNAPGRAQNW
ncbi:predicted protein [Micromonas commoda]|uniref:Uncharacterized protein n=1 Tax=Micromonas commoda (strain RCC299 / NOUM17 / CCMP2709) TaxID=296587 RepID=C1EHS2_MICCC|nr:predicted protein [Micromonas commoda]ACO67734.1 predicted protein [Micromonas commoda]|eukprot:XP_002506476.1 predicted protein [Micromonas commoda]